ncbi:MAG: alpha/beta fold hydrolase [Bacteriovoracaceae bacterium]|nr:alpha/beta fold hydrolase [Bacteriovoracaceae bacterium]
MDNTFVDYNIKTGEERVINDYKKIPSFDKTELNCLVRETGSKCWIIATHGIGEHLERHQYLLKLFSNDFNICLYDLRGHGKSGGRSAYVEDFSFFYQDLEAVLNFLKKTYQMNDYYLFGHSMGALITAGFVQGKFFPENAKKVFLSAPPVAIPGPHGKLLQYAPLKLEEALAKIPFSVKLGGLVDLGYLSHDKRVKENYLNDQLNHMKLHTKLLLNMVYTSRKVFSRPLNTPSELYVAVGKKDRIVSPEALIDYFSNIEKKAELYVSDEGYHEMHNEIEKIRMPYFDFLKHAFMRNEFSL